MSAAAVFAVTLVGTSGPAVADGSDPRCDRMRAEARSEASILIAPRLRGQVIHAPSVTVDDPLAEAGTQVRASVSLSPVDMLRGRLAMRVADAECRLVRAGDTFEPVLEHGAQYGRAGALRAEIAALEAALPRVTAILGEAEARLARQIVAIGEVEALRGRERAMRARLTDARHEAAVLEALVPEAPALDGDAVRAGLGAYERAAIAAEGERSALRRLSPWQIDLRAGVIPPGGASDDTAWFGMVELSYSVGDLFQRAAEQDVRAARSAELRTADDEARRRAERFLAAMRASATELSREIDSVDGELRRLDAERARVAALEGEAARQRGAIAELDGIELGARRAYLERLRAARAALIGGVR
jgi:hypothetical protein